MSATGYKHTADAKRRIGDTTRGKKCASGCGCWKHSEETRQKQSRAGKGRPGPCLQCSEGSCLAHQSRKCPIGCGCGRHGAAARARMELANARRTAETEARRIEALRAVTVGAKWPDRQTEYTQDERQRRSDLSRKMWAEGVFDRKHPCWGKPGIHAGVRMDCLNSEGGFARDLDEAGVRWVYQPRRFSLSWCTYKPDFYLPEFDVWVEVKGYPEQPGNWPAKVDSFRQETGKTLIVVFQRELSSMKYGGE